MEKWGKNCLPAPRATGSDNPRFRLLGRTVWTKVHQKQRPDEPSLTPGYRGLFSPLFGLSFCALCHNVGCQLYLFQ